MFTNTQPHRPADNARPARNLRFHSWLHAALGIVGLAYAAYMIYPKAQRLVAGDFRVFGVGAAANLALLFGSLMFLRNARYFRRRAADVAAPAPTHEGVR